MKIYIKHMVSNRCKMIVKNILDDLNVKIIHIDLGVVEIEETLTDKQRRKLINSLKEPKFELMEDKKYILVEKIKELIHKLIDNYSETPDVNFSIYISRKLCQNYSYISNTFTELTDTTIEQYIIRKKIERVKELLSRSDLNLTQISYQMNYSSVAHLSNQFKKVTGLSPTQYKKRENLLEFTESG